VDPPAQSSQAKTGAGPAFLEGLSETLLEIVSEKTGYPAEMLEADMDMEADLGIDSIKRVEILGAMEERVPGLPAVQADQLAELRTLGQIIDLMGQPPPEESAGQSASSEDKKKAEPRELEVAPAKLKVLPKPDQIEILPDPERPVIITNDHSKLAQQTADQLRERGWKTVIWNFPENGSSEKEKTSLTDAAVQQESGGEEGIRTALEALRDQHGIPAGLIHLHPQPDGEGLASAQEDQLLKQVFLLAGALKGDLERTTPGGRNLFLTVVRSDGRLGLSAAEKFQKGTGLTGLVKTLRWEWPHVFCRALDLEAALETNQASQLIAQEIQDPDRELVEVGISSAGRMTIAKESHEIYD
jgi:acyl carrier protein